MLSSNKNALPSDLTWWIYNIPSEINYITRALNISRSLVSRRRDTCFAQLAAMQFGSHFSLLCLFLISWHLISRYSIEFFERANFYSRLQNWMDNDNTFLSFYLIRSHHNMTQESVVAKKHTNLNSVDQNFVAGSSTFNWNEWRRCITSRQKLVLVRSAGFHRLKLSYIEVQYHRILMHEWQVATLQ